ncbi:MAG: hypothetical protein FWF71_01280 [Actinomycetia bacterium]|nr:hypothetical protein [Actinomycetes bacterium]
MNGGNLATSQAAQRQCARAEPVNPQTTAIAGLTGNPSTAIAGLTGNPSTAIAGLTGNPSTAIAGLAGNPAPDNSVRDCGSGAVWDWISAQIGIREGWLGQ